MNTLESVIEQRLTQQNEKMVTELRRNELLGDVVASIAQMVREDVPRLVKAGNREDFAQAEALRLWVKLD